MAEFEHEMKVLIVDEGLQAKIDALTAEGWQVVPGIQPIAVFHLQRQKAEPAAPGLGVHARLTIDDSKVVILRKDGSIG